MKYELTKLIYIASPFTSKQKNKIRKERQETMRFNVVTCVIGKLQDIFEYAFIGPITQSALTVQHQKKKETTFANWAKRDFTYISRCDEMWVCLMSGWKESTGVQKEIEFCKTMNIPVLYLNPVTLQLFDEEPLNEKVFMSTRSKLTIKLD